MVWRRERGGDRERGGIEGKGKGREKVNRERLANSNHRNRSQSVGMIQKILKHGVGHAALGKAELVGGRTPPRCLCLRAHNAWKSRDAAGAGK